MSEHGPALRVRRAFLSDRDVKSEFTGAKIKAVLLAGNITILFKFYLGGVTGLGKPEWEEARVRKGVSAPQGGAWQSAFIAECSHTGSVTDHGSTV